MRGAQSRWDDAPSLRTRAANYCFFEAQRMAHCRSAGPQPQLLLFLAGAAAVVVLLLLASSDFLVEVDGDERRAIARPFVVCAVGLALASGAGPDSAVPVAGAAAAIGSGVGTGAGGGGVAATGAGGGGGGGRNTIAAATASNPTDSSAAMMIGVLLFFWGYP